MMLGFQRQITRESASLADTGGRFSLPLITLSFELATIAFGFGIVLYFAWPHEPSWVLAACLAGLCLLSAQRLPTIATTAVTLLAIALSGLGWSALQTQITSPNPVRFEQRMQLQGWVSEIDRGGPMRRLVINVDHVNPKPDSRLPVTVRVRVGKAFPDLQIGQGIDIDAVIAPLPSPVTPNGYDPARRAFYDGLAGSGFAISDYRYYDPELSTLDLSEISIGRMRKSIAKRVFEASPERTAGLQTALLTGIRDHIPDQQTESLRASGLAHILAISGLHMGMVSFGVYAALTFMLASIEQWARGRDVRKIAALLGIAAATVYLLLSGASVATQRAFIMVCIAFLAVLLDRRVLSLRSVAIAALLTLLIRPEALLSVGFQMSFAAVTALVVIFRAWQDFRPPRKADGLRERLASFYGSLFGTSLIAGLATGGYALLHFGRIAKYGLLANMAAMTVFPVVMALGILALLVMPLGWDALPLHLMGQALNFMLEVADWVSGLPGAVGTVKASQPIVIALYSLGFVTACLGPVRRVTAGVLMMLASFGLWAIAPTYDLRVSDTGRVSLIVEGRGKTASLRADRYGREQFARASGIPHIDWENFHDKFAQCDALACRMEIRGSVVTIVDEASEVPDACRDSDIVILPDRRAGPVARRACAAILLDGRALEGTGGVYVSLDETIRVVPVVTEARKRRPWGQAERY